MAALTRNTSAGMISKMPDFETLISMLRLSKSRATVTSDANTNLSITTGIFEQGSPHQRYWSTKRKLYSSGVQQNAWIQLHISLT